MKQKREGFNHRTAIKWLIIPVMLITVGYSIFNVSEYASQYHHGAAVWLLGCSVGLANAISVYSLVIAETSSVRWAAVAGISLFGLLSAILQIALYVQSGAFWPVAFALGVFGPLAEGLLSWQHATLSDEQAKVQGRKASNSKQVQGGASKQQEQAISKQPAISLQQVASKTDAEIAALVKVSRQSVNGWRNAGKLEGKILERLPELAIISTNGKEHSHV